MCETLVHEKGERAREAAGVEERVFRDGEAHRVQLVARRDDDADERRDDRRFCQFLCIL